jgi:hypothetical protein
LTRESEPAICESLFFRASISRISSLARPFANRRSLSLTQIGEFISAKILFWVSREGTGMDWPSSGLDSLSIGCSPLSRWPGKPLSGDRLLRPQSQFREQWRIESMETELRFRLHFATVEGGRDLGRHLHFGRWAF